MVFFFVCCRVPLNEGPGEIRPPELRDYLNLPDENENSTFSPLSAFRCFVWLSEQTANTSLYSIK